MAGIKRSLWALMVLAVILWGAAAAAETTDGGKAGAAPSVDSLFLGTKGENSDLLIQMFRMTTNEHKNWRQGFHPEDPPTAGGGNLASPEAAETQRRLQEVLTTLSGWMRGGQTPGFLPRRIWKQAPGFYPEMRLCGSGMGKDALGAGAEINRHDALSGRGEGFRRLF